MKPTNDSRGEWAAYVEAGQTLEERRARLACCPQQVQDYVKSHLKTVFALKRRSKHGTE